MTREEFAQVGDYLRSLLLPEGVVVTFNGDRPPGPEADPHVRGQPGNASWPTTRA